MKQFAYLADHPEFILPVTALGLTTFAHFNPGQTLETRETKIRQCLNKQSLPIIFVAFDNNKLLGTTSLVIDDVPNYSKVSPWLASVIVAPEARDQGIGTWIVTETMKQAALLGYQKWYLYTSDRESFYTKMGWKKIDETTLADVAGVVMQLDLE